MAGLDDWTFRTAPNNKYYPSVVFGGGQFVAVSSTTGAPAGTQIMTSPNGITWTGQNAPQLLQWVSVTYGNGIYLACSQSGTLAARAMISSDGVNWVMSNPGAVVWLRAGFGGGVFVVLGQSNGAYTTDGTTWGAGTGVPNINWQGMAFANGRFVAVGSNGGLLTSTNGINWTQLTTPNTNNWYAVAYGNNIWTSLANTTTNGTNLMTSTDGVTWTGQPAIANVQWFGMTFGSGVFVATAIAGAADQRRIATSEDGINWTLRTTIGDFYGFPGVAFGNNRFVATGNGNTTMSTTDEIIAAAPKGMAAFMA